MSVIPTSLKISLETEIFASAFDKTLVALQAATKAVTGLKHFDLTNFEGHAMVKAFGDAEALIRGSFKSFGVSTALK